LLIKGKSQILAVSIDTHEESKKLLELLAQEPTGQGTLATAAAPTEPIKVDFPLMEDTNHRVIDRYGLLNPEGKGWPHPATYLIDKQGTVRWKFVEVDYKVRATNDMILQALATLP
jgi:peroxiredoxin